MSDRKITADRSLGAAEPLANHIVGARYEDFSSEVITVAKTIILDGIANMLAGSRQPLAKISLEFVQSMGGVGKSTVVGSQLSVNPAYAAFANAAFCHCLDYEAM